MGRNLGVLGTLRFGGPADTSLAARLWRKDLNNETDSISKVPLLAITVALHPFCSA